jgi:hypothetical protein
MQDQQPEPKHPHEYRLFSAVTVITIGVIFLMRNLGVKVPFLDSSKWWAWLILTAALAPLTRAFEVFRARGKVDAEAIYSLLVAGAIILVAVMFLLGLDWQVWWPLFVILGGLFTLVRKPYQSHYWTRRRSGRDDASDATLRR